MPTIKFGSLDAAQKVRNNSTLRGFIAPADNARRKTVTVKSSTPERALSRIQGEAAESRQHKAEQHGQVELTRKERRQIDFTDTNVPTARSVKGIALGEGVSNWTDHFDKTLSVDEHRPLFKNQTGDRRLDEQDETDVTDKMARANQARKQRGLSQMKQYAFDGDEDARSELLGQGSRSDVLDISFSRSSSNTLSGSGKDFDRLQDAHESRSSRAQTLDEKKSAPVTRDPFEWQDNPAQFDFPGVDTVDPNKLHSNRSEQAREVDNNELAPIADSKQEWAMNPDEFDLPGVDTPEDFDDDGPNLNSGLDDFF